MVVCVHVFELAGLSLSRYKRSGKGSPSLLLLGVGHQLMSAGLLSPTRQEY